MDFAKLFKRPTIKYKVIDEVKDEKGRAFDCIVKIECVGCGKPHHYFVVNKNLQSYFKRELAIQDAFPHLNMDDREMFQSGNCAICWDKLFNEPDDKD